MLAQRNLSALCVVHKEIKCDYASQFKHELSTKSLNEDCMTRDE